MRRRKTLNWFTIVLWPGRRSSFRSSSRRRAISPGRSQLGGLMQIADAFGSVQNSLSFIVKSYTEIADMVGGVAAACGLRPPHRRHRRGRAAPQRIAIEPRAARASRSTALDLDLPDGTPLLRGHRARGGAGRGGAGHRPDRHRQEHAAARRRRAVAVRPRAACASARARLFLPQRPYLPLGTLAEAICLSRARITGAPAELGRRCRGRADLSRAISSTRRAIGRSACRSASSSASALPACCWPSRRSSSSTRRPRRSTRRRKPRLYRLLREAEWRPTIVSVGHHGTLRRFHDRRSTSRPSAAAATWPRRRIDQESFRLRHPGSRVGVRGKRRACGPLTLPSPRRGAGIRVRGWQKNAKTTNRFRAARLEKLDDAARHGDRPLSAQLCAQRPRRRRLEDALRRARGRRRDRRRRSRSPAAIRAIRNSGMFIDLHDASGKIQIFSHKDFLPAERSGAGAAARSSATSSASRAWSAARRAAS